MKTLWMLWNDYFNRNMYDTGNPKAIEPYYHTRAGARMAKNTYCGGARVVKVTVHN